MSPFVYKAGDSLLHSMDPRCKLVLLCLLSVAVLKAQLPGLTAVSILLLILMRHVRIPLLHAARHLRYFFVLLFFVFASRSLTTPGEAVTGFMDITATAEGLRQGAYIAWRFLLVMVTGMLFSGTTKPSAVKTAAEWFLKPLPFIPEKKASSMIGLAIRFLPYIILQAKEVADAQNARCANLQKNPLKRLARLAVPLLKKSVSSADRLALAMESRCFSQKRTDPEFRRSGYEIPCILTALFLAALLIFF